MPNDPLKTTLLDLDAYLGGGARLCVGGGYGLYLKHLHLTGQPGTRTLFPRESWPPARTTNDIDLFLRAELVANSSQMARIRTALDDLGFHAVPGAEYMQFVRAIGPGNVKVDLLVGPLGEWGNQVKIDARRVKPVSRAGLHARRCDEAVAIEEQPLEVSVSGVCSNGSEHATTVLIPQAFSYLLMKLLAFRDRLQDTSKDFSRYHALDVYRIVALITEDEYAVVERLSAQWQDTRWTVEARTVVARYFSANDRLGILRMREHSLGRSGLDLDKFRAELAKLLPPP